MHKIRSLLRQATRRDDEPLNILTFPTHERYESMMCHCGHNFYSLGLPNRKRWDKSQARVPDNYTLLEVSIPTYLNIDLVLSQCRSSQYTGASELAKSLSVPLINLQHTLPDHGMSDAHRHELQSRRGFIDVFVSRYSQEQWGSAEEENAVTNMTGIDTDKFCPDDTVEKDGTILTVANQFAKRGMELGFKEWMELVGFPEPFFPVKVIGDTPGLSMPTPNIEILIGEYRKSSVYLNTTIVSTLPTTIIEAMACGLPIVSTATCLIPETLVEHGVNGYVSNNIFELRKYCHELINNPTLAAKMGNASREKALREFTVQRFADTWDQTFRRAANMRTA